MPLKMRGKKVSDAEMNVHRVFSDEVFNSGLSTMHNPTSELTTYNIKLGWIQGVLIPCLLNIWGVMLFLRIAWVVAQAGIVYSMVIISISAIVCIITTMSLSALCTNGELKGGGVYYLVSRSLGAEFGGSVGIIFAFANAVAASMNVIGFCSSLNHLLGTHGLKIVDNDVHDIRIVGTIALLVMCFICAIGMDWEAKTQNLLIVTIVIAIINYILGVFIGPRDKLSQAQGFVGLSQQTLADNALPDYRVTDGLNQNFFSVFAIYFPAVTGVQAGANICGDLNRPASAIPKGTMLAVAISTTSYMVMALLAGSSGLRDASGRVDDLNKSELTSCKPDCDYGLHNNYEIMGLMSAWGPLMYAGCWAATLSTALTNLLAVPRLIQALGVDRIYPGLVFFSKPYGKHGEPYRGYVLTFAVSFIFLQIADLNAIAPLITNFYLASYALINFCTFHADFIKHISWRPTFRCHNRWVSLIGFLLCSVIMAIISWVMASATVAIFIALYLLVLYRPPKKIWGSSADAQRYKMVISNILSMSYRVGSGKSYNPQILVLSGMPKERPALLAFGSLITKTGSFFIAANIIEKQLSYHERTIINDIGTEWLKEHKYRGFYSTLSEQTLESGTRTLIEAAGLGQLKSNILLIGFKNNWMETEYHQYVSVIRCAYENGLALTILRTQKPSMTSQISSSEWRKSANNNAEQVVKSEIQVVLYADSDEDSLDDVRSINVRDPKWKRIPGEALSIQPTSRASLSFRGLENNKEKGNVSYQSLLPTDIDDDVKNIMKFQSFNFIEDDFLDVWCIYDDGGLNLLIPYIIAHRSKVKMKLRIHALTKQKYYKRFAEQRMSEILEKFRIQYSSLTIIDNIDEEPSNESKWIFDDIMRKYTYDNNTENEENVSGVNLLDPAELAQYRRKTHRYLKLRDLLLQASKKSALIVISMPLPRNVPQAIFMAWLDVLSRDLPTTLFVRGNNTPVLTFTA